MKTILKWKLVILSVMIISQVAKSQNDNTTYTVTDSINPGGKWNFLRQVNLTSGTYSDTLVRLLSNAEMQPFEGLANSGVAALALDRKNKRVYFTPMVMDKLSYVDLRTMTVQVAINNFTGLMPKLANQSNIITRMIIADDRNGYALTNDGNHLVRFTTGSDPSAIDLGPLVDDQSNGEMSVHNTCSSYGGDMVADDDGNLYLITSHNYVFRINLQTRITKYLGTVSGLPQNFLASGVAVNDMGAGNSLVLVSSTDATDLYTLDLQTLIASGIHAQDQKHASDLGNGNILKTRKQTISTNLFVWKTIGLINENVQIYPNPVTEKEFKIEFTNTIAGLYTVTITNVDGRSVLSKFITLTGKTNIVSISLPKIVASGMYGVRIVDTKNNGVFNGKIIVE